MGDGGGKVSRLYDRYATVITLTLLTTGHYFTLPLPPLLHTLWAYKHWLYTDYYQLNINAKHEHLHHIIISCVRCYS